MLTERSILRSKLPRADEDTKRLTMKRFQCETIISLILFVSMAVAGASQAQTLQSFPLNGSDGAGPYAALTQGTDGNFYGPTWGGGGSGDILRVTRSGELTTVYQFCSQPNCVDGALPYGGLLLASNGKFYGTTWGGGANGGGTIFQITENGKLTTLYSFSDQGVDDAQEPMGTLAQGVNGNFYGTTRVGGSYGQGTVFEITPRGQLTILYNFCSAGSPCPDGQQPEAGLTLGLNGNFYGTTSGGGINGVGAIFEITSAGKLTTLYSFCSQAECADGGYPYDELLLGTDGNFYGTTWGTLNSGTIFKITPQGKLTTSYRFCSRRECSDGKDPFGGLIEGSDGNLYGTTTNGGVNENCPFVESFGCGTVFQFSQAGVLSTLYNFCAGGLPCIDGIEPQANLVQSTDGSFYGSTITGGGNSACSGGCGTFFNLSMNLAPFVRVTPGFGHRSDAVIILGKNLAGATSVTFNGTPASFEVISDTYIRAQVPKSATTGTIVVTVGSEIISGNAAFRVIR
jgi:uncharacterized repeat protein (TIGR03803 family)